jgi:type I restriction enzyme S subunit
MQLMQGSMQTKSGEIPKDWVLKGFAELFEFSGGYSASREQLSEIGYHYLHYGDIHGSKKTYLDITKDSLDIPRLNIPLKKISSKSLLEDGDVVFVDASEDDEGTSKHVVIFNEGDSPFISGLHTIVAKSKTDDLVREYKKYCFQTAAIKDQFLFYSVGTKVSGISKSNIAKLHIPIPPRAEQIKIASALSDVDALLDALDLLISKKKFLKKAAMQQLLSGVTKLSGYSGEWAVRKLRDLANLIRENVIPADEPEKIYFHYSLPAFDHDRMPTIEPGSAIGSNKFRVPKDAVLVSKLNPRIPRVWCPSDISEDAVASTEFLILTPKKGVIKDFLYVACSSILFSEKMELGATGTTGSHQRISPSDAMDIEIIMPTDISEQAAIAEVFKKMDLDIDALTKRRNKTVILKQGMMQELLTGKTRLI